MTHLTRRGLIAGLTSLPAAGMFGGAAFAQESEPRRVPYELVQDAIALDGAAFVGSRQPDVVIVEFFDYNCPFCRQSAQDMEMLLGTDDHLGYVLVNYAILGEPSVEATRVALAYSGMYGHEKYAAFHMKLFASRGVKNGQRALDAAIELGAHGEELIAFADSDAVTQAMKDAV
ncbi:MAG TPA: DsbA family protein, partial [Saliniramus sp.]|nr:DsbA family protein [Saliniramus sp.]